MGFLESNNDLCYPGFAVSYPTIHSTGDEMALATPSITPSPSERENPNSPLPSTDEACSSIPSPGGSSVEGISDSSPSNANGQEAEGAKSKSLRQRTAQACDKCRERKTKCSGHRPVCVRCTNRGLICEYTARESRIRSRPRAVPSPNPFQVNYQSSGGRPTPAYHSRMGQSQTNAYDRTHHNKYGIFTPNPPIVSSQAPYAAPPTASSSRHSSSSHSRNQGLVIPRNDLVNRYPPIASDHGVLGQEAKSPWDISSPDQQYPLVSNYFEKQRATPAVNSPYTMRLRQDWQEKEHTSYGYDLLAACSHPTATTQALNSVVYGNQSAERTVLHGETSHHMSLPDFPYHQFSIDGSIVSPGAGASIYNGSGDSTSSTSIGLDPEYLNYKLPPAYDSHGYANWPNPNLLSVPMQDAGGPLSNVDYGNMESFNASYPAYPEKHPTTQGVAQPSGEDGNGNNGGSGSGNRGHPELMCPAPSMPICVGAYSVYDTMQDACGSFDDPGAHGLLAHTPDQQQQHQYGEPPVSEAGDRFDGYKFYR